MKKSTVILFVFASLIVGLLLGYLFFSGPNNEENLAADERTNKTEIWTCSMHPQVRKPEPGDCPICGMDLIPADQGGSGDPNIYEMTDEAVKLANIQTLIVDTKNQGVTQTLKLNGKIEANESKISSLVSHLPGRIESLHLSFIGEKVTKGQKIATVYSPKLISAQQELFEAKKLETSNPDLLTAVKQKLRYWKLSEKEIESIITSGEIKSTFPIYAEFSGVVEKRNVAVGDYLSPGKVLFQVKNLNNLWVIFDAYESDLNTISVGQTIEFTTPATKERIYTSTVSYIDPIINLKTRVAGIRVETESYKGQLKPGMFVSGKIFPDAFQANEVLVPKTAILWTGERSVVYLAVPNSKIPSFKFQEVKLGQAIGKQYVIKSGIKLGDEVVINGAFVIDASAQLNNQTSMMNRLVNGDRSLKQAITDYTAMVPEEFKAQLEHVMATYVHLKDAFVASNTSSALEELVLFDSALNYIDMKLLKGEAHMFWMNQLKAISSHSATMKTKSNLEDQRKEFSNISDLLIATSKSLGLNEKMFIQYCPMAFDNQGANWLSADKEIRNPYFGDKMLKCGEITDSIANIE